MPIYEYRCQKCGHVTSFLEKASTKKRHTCERCKSEALEKIFSTFSASSGKSSSGGSSCPTGTCPLT